MIIITIGKVLSIIMTVFYLLAAIVTLFIIGESIFLD